MSVGPFNDFITKMFAGQLNWKKSQRLQLKEPSEALPSLPITGILHGIADPPSTFSKIYIYVYTHNLESYFLSKCIWLL